MRGSIKIASRISAYLLKKSGDNLVTVNGDKLMIQKDYVSVSGNLSAPVPVKGTITATTK